MIIKELTLTNFRGYKELTVPLHDKFNLIIGDNGSGKTAILEALTVAMGSLFLGIINTQSRHILPKDVHISTLENSQEFGFPVIVKASGTLNNEPVTWQRELTSLKSKTLIRGALKIKDIGKQYDKRIRSGEEVNLPVLAYYATGRLFDEARDREEKLSKNPEIASRLRAYNQCLQAKMTFKKFIRWFKGKEISRIQKGEADLSYILVKETIVNTIPGCKNVFFEFDPDKSVGFTVILDDGRTLPFNYLSDGTRNFIALIADIAFKCVTLNPHLKRKALTETSGIVLIDELDLHLHPEWQRQIVSSLKNTFPKVQFVTTTHSPFLIQETEENQLIKLKNNQIETIGEANNLSIEDIVEEFQDVENPQWSLKRQLMFEKSKEYYKAVKEGTESVELKNELDEAMKPFSGDTAYYAILEQERLVKEADNHETNK